jgi:maleate cis-trans isomerase
VSLRLEAETGIPVAYQDQAALWLALKIFGRATADGEGQLFTSKNSVAAKKTI